MIDQNKTHGVLTCNCPAGLKAYWLHAPNCPVRVAKAALIDPYDGGTWQVAPQSPVAPADERAFPGAPVCSVCSTLIGSAPTVSATEDRDV